MDADRIPVIIGAGEVIERPAEPLQAREPAALMAEALRRAAADAGAPDLLAALDSLDIVNSVSWPYGDLPAALVALPRRAAAAAGLWPGRRREPGAATCTRRPTASPAAKAWWPPSSAARRRMRWPAQKRA